jgi:hypothetical protein
MPDIALYYPYTHVRDESWLKAAALYLPKLALLAPRDYPFRFSSTAQVLRDELDFLVEVDPARRAHSVSIEFLELLNRDAAALATRYAWHEFPEALYDIVGPDGDRCYTHGRTRHGDANVEWIHLGKVSPDLVDGLIETKLGVPNANRMWIALHPRLGATYLSALADQVARANGMPVVTDQVNSYGTLNGWSLDTLASVLLSDETETPDVDRPEGEIASLYAAIAINAVVPAGIDALPAGKIVEIRHKLAPEFDAFCAHLDSLAEQFTELARVEDQGVLHARLTIMAERDLLRPTADLDRGLRGLKLQPARAVMAMKSLELPAAAAAAASGIGLPVAAGQAGMAAAQFIASSIQARQIAEERRRSAAGYLLGIRGELNPAGVVDRVRRMFRRASRYQ